MNDRFQRVAGCLAGGTYGARRAGMARDGPGSDGSWRATLRPSCMWQDGEGVPSEGEPRRGRRRGAKRGDAAARPLAFAVQWNVPRQGADACTVVFIIWHGLTAGR